LALFGSFERGGLVKDGRKKWKEWRDMMRVEGFGRFSSLHNTKSP